MIGESADHGLVREVGGRRIESHVGHLLKACHTPIVGTSVTNPYIVSPDICVDQTLNWMRSIRQYDSDRHTWRIIDHTGCTNSSTVNSGLHMYTGI